MATGDPSIIYLNTTTGAWGNTWADNLITASGSISGASSLGAWSYVTSSDVQPPPPPKALETTEIQEHVASVLGELTILNQRYNIFSPTFKDCEVLAARMLFNAIPKGLSDFGLSAVINGKRNVFLIGKAYAGSEIIETVVDVLAAQRGNITIQTLSDRLDPMWVSEFRYKNPTALVKRLIKEGRPLKELSVKDAIALSTRYTITCSQPTQKDLHSVNPADLEGRKFLEKFGKEVGFKTTLAQLLLDADPIVAEKAAIIAQIILQR